MEALLAFNDKVVYAGEASKAKRLAETLQEAGVKVETIELRDAYVLPGFVDSHLHLGSLGMSLQGIDVSRAQSIEELKSIVAREAGRFSYWVYGRGWDQERLGAWPTRWDLDEVVPNKPVILIRVCGHVAVLNTKAMEELGLLKSSDPRIDRGCNGEPTGIVYEELVGKIMAKVKESIDAVEAVARASRFLASKGIVAVGDMGADKHWLRGLLGARLRGLLFTRVRVYLEHGLFEELIGKGFEAPLGDDMLRIVGVKLFADGALGPRTARLSRPYSDDPSTQGILLMDWRELSKIARTASAKGFDVAVHAIGDEALDHVVKGCNVAGASCRIEHASVVRDDQVESLRGFRVSVQPQFIESDFWIEERLGERVKLAYRFKTIMKHALAIGFSSDAPVEKPEPFHAISLAVTRGPMTRYSVGEALSVEEALYAYTRGSALVLGDERMGCLEQGCYPDLVIVDRDPLTVSVEELESIRVLETYVAGSKVY